MQAGAVLSVTAGRGWSRGTQGAKGQQITCLAGVVWLTQANDNRDIILSKGQSFIIDRKGLAVVFALKEAAVAVGPAGHITAAAFDPANLQGLAA